MYTVDGERFAGLNIRGFSAIEVFAEIFSIFSVCLGHKYSLFSIIIIKERHLYSWKNLHSTSENCEKRESLAQQIFPRLRYTVWLAISVRFTFLWILYALFIHTNL